MRIPQGGYANNIFVPAGERDYARKAQVTETALRPGKEEVRTMAIKHQNRTVPIGARTIYVLVCLVENAAKSIRKWRLEQQTRRELSRLSDHQLDDIGLTRSDIQRLFDRL